MAKVLSAAAVTKHKAGMNRREVPDGGCPGLHLVIQPSGAKSWALRFRRPSGRTAKLTLGPVDLSGSEIEAQPVIGAPLTLASARRLAAEVNRQRAMGHDVVAVNHREKLERRARGAKTFAQAAMDFIEQHSKRKNRRWKEQASLLGLRAATEGDGLSIISKGLADRWRDRPIAEMDGDDIHAIVDEVREKGVPGLERRSDGPSEARARKMFAALSKMFSWMIERRRLRQNPCAGVHRPATPKSRERVLSADELRSFWMACERTAHPFGHVLKLLLLTGSRLNEVAGMRRVELSADAQTWTIPGARTKNRRPHVVPLPQLAREIVATVGTEGDVIFTTNGRAPVSGWSKVKKRLDATMAIAPWRLHDLRRTAATGMAEIGISPHIIEACLNHISGVRAGVAGTYNRHAYLPEKKVALELWASHIQGLVVGHPSKVVSLQKAGSRK